MKQYAFWRDPRGKVSVDHKGRYAPEALLGQIGTTAKIVPDGISWPFLGSLRMREVVYPSIAILDPDGDELNENDTFQMVSEACTAEIKRLGGGKPLSANSLLSVVNKKASEFFRQPRKHRLIITSLSVDRLPTATVKPNGFEISQIPNRSELPYPRPLLDNESFVSAHIKRTKYIPISIKTNEGTHHQAIHVGITALNYLRGLWNLFATYRTTEFSFSSYPQRKWLGVVHSGPLHTLHEESTNSANAVPWWYEPDYVEDAPIFLAKEKWNRIEDNLNWAMSKIDTSPLKKDLVFLFARYAIALDQSNLDLGFFMLWNLLETITNTIDYEETIRRAIWKYSDREIAKEILSQLRWRRNQLVHYSQSTEKREHLCYHAKDFVDDHLLTLIRNDFEVSNLQEYGEFLSLPVDRRCLAAIRDNCQRAIAFHSPAADYAI
jgi:hypothetical protein